ncbi:unnamed protein product [Blumeria hordei]|uniref:Uncharacterized protein n=1 Tax=Blumeria hordei TaxID=2867405 RepID=A0A383USN4_BLUHO|nr:unnamed protein product [Blumeria hordei]
MATNLTEESILTNFLLPPAPLPSILSLKAFTALFPSSIQSAPVIKALYRDLQSQRMLIADVVRQNIKNEKKRGIKQHRAVLRARKIEEQVDDMIDDEVEIEEILLGPSCNLPRPKSHTLKSIVPEMALAVEALESEVWQLNNEYKKNIDEIRSTVGEFSDLRYGKLANPQLRDLVIEGCLRLESACDDH